ncbi:MAG: hypothetical protein PQJ61_15255 [Spirochaetales bacterium]|uniref:Uncharacterized protein n=1 Tax=Candidatus Thalassospirochaeta sargassi TaxID=3119039 RepID=A0AAJ1IJ16_9SPIO|nr:hypothetical protein [Spirochaetales bacterium]
MSLDHDQWEKSKVQLEAEIAEFEKEKEEIKALIGSIGGKKYSKRDNVINFVFLAIIVTLFTLEITTHWLPEFISLEISVLLVSIKIVWMIHSQHKYNHFIFWILNTIEFRVNDANKRIQKIERMMHEVKRQ